MGTAWVDLLFKKSKDGCSWIYLLKSKDGRYYAGASQNEAERQRQHEAGVGSTFLGPGKHEVVSLEPTETWNAALVEEEIVVVEVWAEKGIDAARGGPLPGRIYPREREEVARLCTIFREEGKPGLRARLQALQADPSSAGGEAARRKGLRKSWEHVVEYCWDCHKTGHRRCRTGQGKGEKRSRKGEKLGVSWSVPLAGTVWQMAKGWLPFDFEKACTTGPATKEKDKKASQAATKKRDVKPPAPLTPAAPLAPAKRTRLRGFLASLLPAGAQSSGQTAKNAREGGPGGPGRPKLPEGQRKRKLSGYAKLKLREARAVTMQEKEDVARERKKRKIATAKHNTAWNASAAKKKMEESAAGKKLHRERQARYEGYAAA